MAETGTAAQIHLFHGIPDYIVYAALILVILWFVVKGMANLLRIALWVAVLYFLWRNHEAIWHWMLTQWQWLMAWFQSWLAAHDGDLWKAIVATLENLYQRIFE